MPIQRVEAPPQKRAVSFTEMAEMLGLSRTRLYQLIDKGIFEPPVFCVVSRRPFFPADIQARNLEYRATNTSASGGYHCFYRPQRRAVSGEIQPTPQRGNRSRTEPHQELCRELQVLGLTASGWEVDQALRQLYPAGVEGVDESELLRGVYRQLRRR